MATNVSEKDKTLQEVIDWCENKRSDTVKFLQRMLVGISRDNALQRAHTSIRGCDQSLQGHARLQRLHAVRGVKSKRGMMSKDSEALYEFAHWLSEKGREAREELVYKQYTPWIDDVALGRLEAYDEAYKHCREMLGNADSIFSPKFDKETKQGEDTK